MKNVMSDDCADASAANPNDSSAAARTKLSWNAMLVRVFTILPSRDPLAEVTGQRSVGLEPQLLVRRRRRHVRDEPDGGLGDTRPVRGEAGLLEDRRVHDLLVHQLLDAVKDRLALAAVGFVGLLPDE